MAKATGKRGHRTKADEVLSRKATHHQDCAVRLTERAVAMALWPVRAGAHLVGRVLETPIALVRILVARRTA